MMNFSRSYPRVVVYNGQQNFAIGDKEMAKQLPQAPGEKNPSRSTAYYTIPAALALGAGGVYAAQNWGDLFPAEQTAMINGYRAPTWLGFEQDGIIPIVIKPI